MILQELVKLYGALEKKGELGPLGWSKVGVSFALCIDRNGRLERIVNIKQPVMRGKNEVLVSQKLSVPARSTRAAGVCPYCLCDKASYLLGIEGEGSSTKSKECHEASADLHSKVLGNCNSEFSKAILRFFDTWNPDTAMENEDVKKYSEELNKGESMIFRLNGRYAFEDDDIRQAWEAEYKKDGDKKAACLLSGEQKDIAVLHPQIKGVYGAQSSGAAIVSFNNPSFESYGRKDSQGLNSPIGKDAAFAYGEALNYLLANREYTFRVGDTTVVCFAASGEKVYSGLMGASLYFDSDTALSSYTEADLRNIVKHLSAGEPVEYDETRLSPEEPFCILGLSPNAARLSVRFFLRGSFGNFIKNVDAHYQRLDIVAPSFEKKDCIPLWKLVLETQGKDKYLSPNMTAQTLKAILSDTPYPATLLNGVTLRIRAEHEITRGKAAIIKAYYMKNSNPKVPKEVLTVSCNHETDYVPYNLGRLFALLERIQEAANSGINTTIKDRFFTSAAATPSVVFPQLVSLAQKHLRKIDNPVYFNKQMCELTDKLGMQYPARLSLPEQGSFQLGYYHQRQEYFTPKPKKNNEKEL